MGPRLHVCALLLLSCAGEGAPGPDDPGADPRTWTRVGDTNLTRMRVSPEAWAIGRGAPEVIIGVIDTGLDATLPAFAERLVEGADLVSGGPATVDPQGHGTLLALAAAGAPPDAAVAERSGVCPRCRLVAVRAADRGDAFDALDRRIAEGLRFAASRGAKVALVGLASESFPPETAAAVAELLEAGVSVVAPSGGMGLVHAAYPARLPGVIAVGASFATVDAPTERSNGPLGVDVWAPADPTPLSLAGGEVRASGSSLAAAYVAGVVGLLRSAAPELGPAELRAILRGSAVPLEPGGAMEVLGGGRVDALAALERARSAVRAELRVGWAEPIPRTPRPGASAHVRVRLDNVGTRGVELARVELALEGAVSASIPAGSGALEPGASAWVELDYAAPTSLGPYALSVVARGDGAAESRREVLWYRRVPPSVDELARVVPVSVASARGERPTVAEDAVGALALLGLEELAPDMLSGPRRWRALYANVGGAPLEAGATARVGGAEVGAIAASRWSPGESRALDASIEDGPNTPRWQLVLAPTIDDADTEDDRVAVGIASGRENGFYPAYADISGTNVFFDAPYRIDVDRPYIPILTYIPEYKEGPFDEVSSYSLHAKKARGGHAPAAQVEKDWSEALGGVRLFEAVRGAEPELRAAAGWSPEVIDELGERVSAGRYFGSSDPLRLDGRDEDRSWHPAWHRVLRLPWSVLAANVDTSFGGPTPSAFLLAHLTIRERSLHSSSDYHRWATLRVTRSKLPRFSGREHDRYYDAHFHTIAEGTLTPTLIEPLMPAKDWGAPLVMLAESAYAFGFTEAPELASVKDRIVTTDHNQFYSLPGADVPRDWTPPTGPTSAARDGHGEFAIMRELFGRGAGEEVDVKGGTSPMSGVPPLGRHMLVYDAEHFEGPWHGGDENPLTVQEILRRLRTPAVAGQPASAFPAHPFVLTADPTSPQWRFSDLEELFGLWPHDPRAAFGDDKAPLARGYQIWNQRSSRVVRNLALQDFDRLSPWALFGDATDTWVRQLNLDVTAYGHLVSTGLHYTVPGAPDRHYLRKLYGVGGTDAHGDFNFSHYLTTTLVTTSGLRGLNAVVHGATLGGVDLLANHRPYIYDNAWGKVRTLALSELPSPAAALDAMMHGRAIVGDGPLVKVELDADPRLDARTLAFDLRREAFLGAPEDPSFDEDGRMGGGGLMEGEGTALVLVGNPREVARELGAAPQPTLRYVIANPEESLEPVERVAFHDLRAGPSVLSRDDACFVSRRVPPGASLLDEHRDYWTLPPPLRFDTGAVLVAATTGQLDCVRSGQDPGSRASPFRGADSRIGIANPVWYAVAEGDLEANASCAADGHATLKGAELRVEFPLSMGPPAEVFLQALDADGASSGARWPASELRVEDAPGFAGRRLVARWTAGAMELASNRLGGPPHSGSFVAIVRSPTDIEGNVLNSVALVRHLPVCEAATLCCELNEPTLARRCFGVSAGGMCGECGVGCSGRERCSLSNGRYACEAPTRGCMGCSGCCVPAFEGVGGCAAPGTDFGGDSACGGCNVACGPDQRCVGRSNGQQVRYQCERFDAASSCDRGSACAAGSTCCPADLDRGHACVELASDARNCGACGVVCRLGEACCGGACVSLSSPTSCGRCGAACTASQRCCAASGGGEPSCVPIDVPGSCGACGRACGAGESCVEGSCR